MKKLALVIAAFLLLVAAAYYLYLRAPEEYSGPVPELVALAPREAEGILYADLAAWRSSATLEQLRRLLPAAEEDPQYRNFVNETGFDYARDLDRAMLALIPASPVNLRGRPAYHRLAIVEGQFAQDRITAYALKHGLRENHNDQEILVINDTATSDMPQQTRLAFLSGTRISIANADGNDPDYAARARTLILDTVRPLSGNDSLSPLAERTKPIAGAPFFMVLNGAAIEQFSRTRNRAGAAPARAAELLSMSQWLTIAARPEEERIRVSVLAEYKSTWQATQLGLLLDGLLVLARSAVQNAQARNTLSPRELDQLEAILSTIRVERRAETVELRLEISTDAIALIVSGNKSEPQRE
jgi:hypothetical protein